MSHAYVCNLMPCTFSTKGCNPWIDTELEKRLWPYIGGIARENRMKGWQLVELMTTSIHFYHSPER